jgi:acyl-CoA thioester hydrolase
MRRMKLLIPDTFAYSTRVPVRITDINYGGHLGNDSVLTIIHEARMRFLTSLGLSELDMKGVGLIMSDVAIEYRNEAFFGDVLTIHVTATDFTKISFDLFYKLIKDENIEIARARTGMVCFDYSAKKVAALPGEAKMLLEGVSN